MNVTGTSLTERKEKRSKRREQEDQENGDEASAGFGTGFDDNDADDDENWSTDVSKEAVKKRMKELTSGVKGLAMDDDIEKPESERVNILLVFVKDKLENEDFGIADEKAVGHSLFSKIVSRYTCDICMSKCVYTLQN